MKLFMILLVACILIGCSDNGGNTAPTPVDNPAVYKYDVGRPVSEFRPILAPDYVCITFHYTAMQCVHSPAKY